MNQTRQQNLSEFPTRDVYLASVLKQAKIPLLRIEASGQRGIFVFKNSEKIEPLISQYFNNELRTDPQELFSIWKALKAQAFSAINDVR